jgi:uncharacterized protein YpuA (DUF1002 family)
MTYLFIQSAQRASEWRSSFASAALAGLKAFFAEKELTTTEECKRYAEMELVEYAFLYSQVARDNNGKASSPLCVVRHNTNYC